MAAANTGTANNSDAGGNNDIIVRRSDPRERDKLIMEYAPLVKRIAYRIVSRLPDTILVEDLISIGTLGLIDAVEKYDPSKGKSFRAYAELRIKGSILDELRGYDNLSRANRRRANILGQAIQDLEHKYGRSPTDEELAEILNMDMEELHSVRNATRSVVFLDIDDMGYMGHRSTADHYALSDNTSRDYTPFSALSDKNLKFRVEETLAKLPEKLRMVLSLYYYSELNYKEIGQVLNLSESRISQLHSKAVLRLRKALKTQENTE